MSGAWTKLTADAWNLENLSPKGGEMERGSKEEREGGGEKQTLPSPSLNGSPGPLPGELLGLLAAT